MGGLHKISCLIPRAESILSKAAMIVDIIDNQINPLHRNLSPPKNLFRIRVGDHLKIASLSVTLFICFRWFLSFDG